MIIVPAKNSEKLKDKHKGKLVQIRGNGMQHQKTLKHPVSACSSVNFNVHEA